MKEVDVSMKGLFFYILKRWKSIVVAMLIGAIALCGFKVVRNSGHTQSTLSVGATLTDSEKDYVESVYNYLNEIRAVNEKRTESLFMNLDPDNLVKSELTFMISVDASENIEGVEQAFKNYLNGTEFVGYISDDTNISNMDIVETVTISYERSRDIATNTAIKISIISDNELHAEQITNAVYSYLDEKSNELFRSGYEHELKEIGSSICRGEDFTILNRQLQLLQEVQSRNKTIVDTENSIKDALKDYYNSLVTGVYEETTATDINNSSKSIFTKSLLKYLVLGLLVGAFLMCGFYFVIYIIANRLEYDDDVEGMFGTYLIGTVTGNDYGKALYKLRHFGKRSFDFDESIKIISTKIKMTARKEGTSTIGILGCGIMKYNEKVANEIVTNLKKDGIEVALFDEPIYDPSTAERLSGVNRVVLLEKAGVTYRSEIWNEIELIKKLGITAEGIIIAE